MLNFELKRGPNVMEELLSHLESLARQVYVEKGKCYASTGTTEQKRDDASVYRIWEERPVKRRPNVVEAIISSLVSLARQIYVEKRKLYTSSVIADQKQEDATVFPTMITGYLIIAISPTSF